MQSKIIVFRSVLANLVHFASFGAPEPPFHVPKLTILAVLGNLVLALVLLCSPAFGQFFGQEDIKLGSLTIDPAVSLQNQTVIYFACETTEEMEEQGFKDCGEQTVPGFESAPNWTLGLSLNVCPTDNATFIATHGPVKIKWPDALAMNLELDESCKVPVWVYYHENWDGSFVGLRIDPKTQRLSIEQSEVAFR